MEDESNPPLEDAYTTQAQAQALLQEQTDLVEYVREFSEDRPFTLTKHGLQGNIPQRAKETKWAINNPNLVWSNIPSIPELNRIQIMGEDIDMVETMYRINNVLVERAWKIAEENHDTGTLDKLQKVIQFYEETRDRANQRIHTRTKTLRAYSGEGNMRERMAFISKGIVSQHPGNETTGGGNWMQRLFGGGKKQ